MEPRFARLDDLLVAGSTVSAPRRLLRFPVAAVEREFAARAAESREPLLLCVVFLALLWPAADVPNGGTLSLALIIEGVAHLLTLVLAAAWAVARRRPCARRLPDWAAANCSVVLNIAACVVPHIMPALEAPTFTALPQLVVLAPQFCVSLGLALLFTATSVALPFFGPHLGAWISQPLVGASDADTAASAVSNPSGPTNGSSPSSAGAEVTSALVVMTAAVPVALLLIWRREVAERGHFAALVHLHISRRDAEQCDSEIRRLAATFVPPMLLPGMVAAGLQPGAAVTPLWADRGMVCALVAPDFVTSVFETPDQSRACGSRVVTHPYLEHWLLKDWLHLPAMRRFWFN